MSHEVKQVSGKGRKQFQDMRFGMFIHWGLYSIIGKHAGVMNIDRIPVSDYEKLAREFNPTGFNADDWIRIAAEAGQKYMVITSRHHDGFSMYDTALSEYKVTNTPFARDPIEELADACARHGGMKLGFYSSLIDWHHPAYRFREESGLAWSDYIDYLHEQVRELCTNYGEIACMWFDGDWPRIGDSEINPYHRPAGLFEYGKLYNMIHTLQPDAIVANNRHEEPLPGEDIQNFEQDLPGMTMTNADNTETIYDLPLEVCMTINDHWGYCTTDLNVKTARHIVHLLVRSASMNANFLLNVGPTGLGEIVPLHASRLREVGQWLAKHSESIYEAREGVIPPTATTVSTSARNTHYIHVLDYTSDCVHLTDVPDSITQANLLNGTDVKMERQDNKLMLFIPAEQRDDFNTVVKLL